MSDYIAILHKDAESDYGVSFPDFPGCVAAGSSLDEAKDMACEALRGHVETLREFGEPVPGPTSLDAAMADPGFANGVTFLVQATRESSA